MSPEREMIQSSQQVPSIQQVPSVQQVPEQPKQREFMPTSVIQTNFPINNDNTQIETQPPKPISTTIKKEINSKDNLNSLETVEKQNGNKKNTKKVIDLQKLKEEVLIEEASSDEED